MTISNKKVTSKCGLISISVGIIFLFKALMVIIFYEPLQEVILFMMEKELSLTPGTRMLRLWTEPPLTPTLKVYVYNITNPDEILAGKIPRVKELGPYVYSAYQTKNISGWSDSENVITFRSRTLYKFLESESPMSDSDVVTLPNMVMMTGMLKPEVQKQLSFIKKQVVWPLLMSDGHKTPFVKVKVSEFLWGYEDELACLTEPVQTSIKNDLSWPEADDFWSDPVLPENKPQTVIKKFVKPRNFRRPDGRCMFGVLAEKNYTWEGSVSMLSGKDSIVDKGTITDIDGSTDFEIWQPGSPCDAIAGAQEPSATPPVAATEYDLLIGLMCRKVRMQYSHDVNYTDTITAKRFLPMPTAFDPKQDKCYEYGLNGVRLPAGAIGVQGCAEGSPIAASFPHFLHGDNWYLEQVEGISEPDPSLHEMYLDLEPKLGAPVGIQIRFQLNLLLQKDPDFAPLANLGKNLTVLPIFWAQEGYEIPPSRSLLEMELALRAPTIISSGLVIISAVLGSLFIALPAIMYVKKNYRLRTRNLTYDLDQTQFGAVLNYEVLPQDEKNEKELL